MVPLMVFNALHPEKEGRAVPDWLRVINLFDTGQFAKLSKEDKCYHGLSVSRMMLNK